MTPDKEDQIRAEFYAAFPKFVGILEMNDAGAISHLEAMTAVHQFGVWKACAESYEKKLAKKDAANELALTKQQLKNEMNKSWSLESDLSESQLHIKELRECLTEISCPTQSDKLLWWQTIARTALAKQPDTRALDKALLEAEIMALSYAYDSCKPYGVEFSYMITDRIEQLDELSKDQF